MGLKTPLYDTHIQDGAKIIDFGGWDMPLHYGSQINEHHSVRRDAGVFDVSHMAIIDLRGARVFDMLRYLLANDVGRLKSPGKALYSCMLSVDGGVIDDLIVFYLGPTWFRLVVNAGTRIKDLAWIGSHASGFAVEVIERIDLAMLAVQGPNAIAKTLGLLTPELRNVVQQLTPFMGCAVGSWFIARTGYTGEDGFEIMVPAESAAALWASLRAQHIAPVGLGARDTLRLEAGMNLYGQDMDESYHPLESGLAWTVAFDPPERDFCGRAALQELRTSYTREMVGLLLNERGVLRRDQRVISCLGEGLVTSGSYSPTLNASIGLARVPRASGLEMQVEIRGKLHAARVIKPPFVRHGKSLIHNSGSTQ